MTTAVLNILEPGALTIAADGVAEVLQNVRVILTTRVGSVPMDRDFGVSWEMIDMRTPAAKAEMAAEIFDKIHKYEPRATISHLEWVETAMDAMDGRIAPSVTLEIEL